ESERLPQQHFPPHRIDCKKLKRQ
ncbi:cytochrome c family protein, partial [Vibrio parahaemolyticus V-223/04]